MGAWWQWLLTQVLVPTFIVGAQILLARVLQLLANELKEIKQKTNGNGHSSPPAATKSAEPPAQVGEDLAGEDLDRMIEEAIRRRTPPPAV